MPTTAQLVAVTCFSGAVLLACLGTTDNPRPVEVRPSLLIEPREKDFGTIQQHEAVVAAFRVRNTFPEPVEVQKILRGCSCADTEIGSSIIQPGSEETLTVKWRVGTRRGRSIEVISLQFTVGSRPVQTAECRVAAVITPAVEADVDVIEFDRSKPSVVNVAFKSHDGSGLQLLSAVSNHPSITPRCLTDGTSIAVSFDPTVTGWTTGRLWVQVLTGNVIEPEVVLPVYVR
jgi:hypothetical protein